MNQEMIRDAIEYKTKQKIKYKKTRDPFKPVPSFCKRLLSKYGKNPYGQPIYRVIWNEHPINCEVSGGYWGDTDSVEYKKLYNANKPRYILQKWLPAEEFGSPLLFFDTHTFTNNLDHGLWSDPIYPSHGRYEHVYTFQNDISEDPNFGEYETPYIYKMILVCQCIEAGKLITRQERMDARKIEKERKELEERNKMQDVISDAMLPFEGSPYFNKKLEEYEAKQKLLAKDVNKKFGLPEQPGFAQIRGN